MLLMYEYAGVKLGIRLLSFTDKLATSLQNPCLTASDAMLMANNVTDTLAGLRSDGKFHAFKDDVDSVQVSLGRY